MADELDSKAENIIKNVEKKGLEARVKAEYNLGSVMAFSGHEYSAKEWRPVPAGSEAAALAHPYLDVREAGTEKEIPVASQDYVAKAMAEAANPVEEVPVVEVEEETEEESDEEEKKSTGTSSKRKKRK